MSDVEAAKAEALKGNVSGKSPAIFRAAKLLAETLHSTEERLAEVEKENAELLGRNERLRKALESSAPELGFPEG